MPGGKLEKFRSVYDGFDSFLFTPNTTSQSGVHIHDSNDSKRTMIIVVLALMPALLFGMYNVGYQRYLSIGQPPVFLTAFLYGFLALLPKIITSYAVGLGIEFASAQIRKHEIQEGFLVSGILIPMICPIETPIWMIAVATAFSVIFVKEVFGGTGMNIFNVALMTRAFYFSPTLQRCRATTFSLRITPYADWATGLSSVLSPERRHWDKLPSTQATLYI